VGYGEGMQRGRLKFWLGAFVYEYQRRSELPIVVISAIAWVIAVLSQDGKAFVLLGSPAAVLVAIRIVTGFANIELERRAKWYPIDFADVRKMATEQPSSTGEARGS